MTKTRSPEGQKKSEIQVPNPPAQRPVLCKNSDVRERIIQLKPNKRDGVVNSISAMFQFTGGLLQEQEIQKVITSLQTEKFFTIDADGRVKYSRI